VRVSAVGGVYVRPIYQQYNIITTFTRDTLSVWRAWFSGWACATAIVPQYSLFRVGGGWGCTWVYNNTIYASMRGFFGEEVAADLACRLTITDVPIKNGIPRRHSFIIAAENAKGRAAAGDIILLLLYWIIHDFNDSWCDDILLCYALEPTAVRAYATVERRLHCLCTSLLYNYSSLNHVIHIYLPRYLSVMLYYTTVFYFRKNPSDFYFHWLLTTVAAAVCNTINMIEILWLRTYTIREFQWLEKIWRTYLPFVLYYAYIRCFIRILWYYYLVSIFFQIVYTRKIPFAIDIKLFSCDFISHCV